MILPWTAPKPLLLLVLFRLLVLLFREFGQLRRVDQWIVGVPPPQIKLRQQAVLDFGILGPTGQILELIGIVLPRRNCAP